MKIHLARDMCGERDMAHIIWPIWDGCDEYWHEHKRCNDLIFKPATKSFLIKKSHFKELNFRSFVSLLSAGFRWRIKMYSDIAPLRSTVLRIALPLRSPNSLNHKIPIFANFWHRQCRIGRPISTPYEYFSPKPIKINWAAVFSRSLWLSFGSSHGSHFSCQQIFEMRSFLCNGTSTYRQYYMYDSI